MKFEYQDKIDSYVQGAMTEDERKAFEQEVKNNDELRDQLEYTQKVKTLVTSRREKMALLQQWDAEHRKEEEQIAASQYRPTGTENYCPVPSYQTTTKPKSKKLFYWISGIAAVLVVGFFIINPLFFFDSSGSSNEQFRGDDDIFAPNEQSRGNGKVFAPNKSKSIKKDSISNDSIFVFDDEE